MEAVIFTTSDGIDLAGTLFSDGNRVVIMAHQDTFGADQKTWYSFARLLAEHGYTALAFDFHGVGQSGCKLSYSNLAVDMAAIVRVEQDHSTLPIRR